MTVTDEREKALLDSVPTGLLIDGKWRDASSGKTFDVKDPATGMVLASLQDANSDDAMAAFDAACAAQADWAAYHGSSAQTHYSTLEQINTANVGKLREVWRYDSGDEFKDSEMQCNPLVIGGVL